MPFRLLEGRNQLESESEIAHLASKRQHRDVHVSYTEQSPLMPDHVVEEIARLAIEAI